MTRRSLNKLFSTFAEYPNTMVFSFKGIQGPGETLADTGATAVARFCCVRLARPPSLSRACFSHSFTMAARSKNIIKGLQQCFDTVGWAAGRASGL